MSAGNDYWPAKVETMRKIEAELRAEYQTLWDAFTEAQMQRDAERAELRRLRAALEEIWHNGEGYGAKIAGEALRLVDETFPVQGGDILPPSPAKPWKEAK